ncbi:MAG: hypothetical protein DWQ29_15825 [Planctomycetota bacterium]|nr:MAG: hypothetical protein DWQ29_15825 [Planctomycetota bacterium]
MAKSERKFTAAPHGSPRERKRKFMPIFIQGKQKRVPRPATIDGFPVEEFLARNPDPIRLYENGLWEMMPMGDDD